MNKFVDCKVYIVLFLEDKTRIMVDNVFWVDIDYLSERRREMPRFLSPHQMVTIVFAEKGEHSTVDRSAEPTGLPIPRGMVGVPGELGCHPA